MTSPSSALDVFLTVDTEIWCDGWNNIDTKFPSAFNKYIYGKTASGDYGLPFQLRLLKEHDLKAVFFVEPLFATRFGVDALQEIVGMIKDQGQSVELHLHTEWIDEAIQPLFPHIKEKREHIKYFDYPQQCELISLGKELLQQAGCKIIRAFRAGSFGANDDTIKAVEFNNIGIDSSYNFCMDDCEITMFDDIQQSVQHGNITEVPMSTFVDGLQRRRHVQLTACSYAELASSLQQAHQHAWNSFVLLSHSSELLKPNSNKHDRIAVRRFEKLCHLLADNTQKFKTCDFEDLQIKFPQIESPLLQVGRLPTLQRYYEQSVRRVI